jgi:hypothetical protein
MWFIQYKGNLIDFYALYIIFHILCSYWHINNHTFLFFFRLLLPIIDLLQQFVWRLCQGNCVAKKKRKKSNNKKISLKICTKQGVNLKIRWGSGSPEGLDWVTQHCTFCEVMIRVIVSSAVDCVTLVFAAPP